MKYHSLLKILAIFLAACMLLVSFIGALGIVYLYQNNMYSQNLEQWQDAQREQAASMLADNLILQYTAREVGQCSPNTLRYLGFDVSLDELSFWYNLDPQCWDYSIQDSTGTYVVSNFVARLQRPDTLSYSFTMSCDYPREVMDIDLAASGYNATDAQNSYYNGDHTYFLYYYPSEIYTVTIRMTPDAYNPNHGLLTFMQLAQLHNARYQIIGLTLTAFVIFVLCLVYLCFAAGRSSDGSILNPRGLNRLPLDLYLVGAGLVCVGGLVLGVEGLDSSIGSGSIDSILFAISLAILLAVAIVGLCFCFAAAAQFKMKNGWWWRHTLIGRLLRLCYRCCKALFRLLPLIWQWLLVGAAMGISSLFWLWLMFIGQHFWGIPFVLSILCNIAIICYGAYAFGVLQKGAKRMAEGDLNTKINTKYLVGAFRDHAQQLNALSDAATVAARKLLKSERMKTELITNVSHDIKTPLTSIINYVDLLEKPHTEEEGIQYLDVLSHQSQRLKKLTEDLVEMSKASTGNISTNIISMDLTEAVNQALGEFADKLAFAELNPVFRQPEEPVTVMADGRLTWRVLSNLLSNIVKYALSGTRVYIDINRYQNNVLLSIKNISKEELNVDAEELTERFVRGDTSRNTEGSGLGLNIAKSLMELQKGQLNLVVDGDLFKVTLTFPAE